MAVADPHLLLFGWYREGTGFTRVLQALLPFLAQRHRVTWMGLGYHGEPRRLAANVELRPTNLHGGDLVGAYQARLDWPSLCVDRVLALNDPWWLEHYPRELDRVLGEVPMHGYLPLDGDIPDPELLRGLAGFRSLFTYTEHAADQLRTALVACDLPIPVVVAGHGVDLSAFAPLHADIEVAARMRLAQQVFGLSEPSWVVLNASRPDPRKRIDLSIEGFARFVDGGRRNVHLCLHQALSFPQFVEPLRRQADELGIADRILWWPPNGEVLDDAALNRIYNACAVGLNTSLGEGFGLVSFEHAATGAPQLLPDHPALRELWGDAALRLAPVRPLRTEHSPLLLGAVEPQTVADGLCRLHEDANEYRRLAVAGLARCAGEDLRWQTSARRLSQGFDAPGNAEA